MQTAVAQDQDPIGDGRGGFRVRHHDRGRAGCLALRTEQAEHFVCGIGIEVARGFVGEFNERYGCHRTMSEQTLALLIAYDWPGNVRELRNVVERLIVTCESDVIDPEFLDGVLPREVLDAEPNSFRQRVERFERRLVEDAMRQVGNTRDAARLLGLSQSSVVRKLRAAS